MANGPPFPFASTSLNFSVLSLLNFFDLRQSHPIYGNVFIIHGGARSAGGMVFPRLYTQSDGYMYLGNPAARKKQSSAATTIWRKLLFRRENTPPPITPTTQPPNHTNHKIGRASCRERV